MTASEMPLRRNRAFQLLWVAQASSELGSTMTSLVTPLLVLALTHSPATAGAVAMLTYLARIVFSLPIGALLDRHPRRGLLIGAGMAGFVASATLWLAAWRGFLTVPIILVATLIWGACQCCTKTGLAAASREVVPPSQRAQANSLRQARVQAVDLIGPPAGGALYGIARALPFGVDALSYLISSALVLRWKETYTPQASSGTLLADIRAGADFIWRSSWQRHFVIWAALLNFGGIGFDICINLRLAHHGVPAYQIGLVNTFGALLALGGALIAPRLINRMPTTRLTVLTTVFGSLSFLMSAFTLSVPLVAVFMGFGMFLFPANNTALGAFIANHTPDHMQGRISATSNFFINGLTPLSPLLAGLMLDWGFGGFALATFAVVTMMSLVPIVIDPVLGRLPKPAQWDDVAD